MFLLIICIVLIIMICIYCLNNKIVEGYDLLQNCIGTYDEYYEPCSKTCGGGTQKLAFNVDIDHVSGYFRGNWQDAVQCRPDLTRECNTHNCPIDCKYVLGGDGWGEWDKNLDSNGKQIGTETRTRQIRIKGEYGGKSCDNLTETRKHNVNCEYVGGGDGWGVWDKNLDSNGKQIGTETRTREILVNEINNGTPCGKVTETRNHDVDCVQSAWSKWGACSRPCGGGTKTRTRSTLQEKKNGGQSCEPSSDKTSCNIDNCPINCEGDWHWVGCVSSNRLKQYKVTRNSAHKGKSCPVPDKKVSWVAGACYRSCALSGRCGPPWKRYNCCKKAGGWLPK